MTELESDKVVGFVQTSGTDSSLLLPFQNEARQMDCRSVGDVFLLLSSFSFFLSQYLQEFHPNPCCSLCADRGIFWCFRQTVPLLAGTSAVMMMHSRQTAMCSAYTERPYNPAIFLDVPSNSDNILQIGLKLLIYKYFTTPRVLAAELKYLNCCCRL